ncbi:hypothetical protein ERJ75_000136600 [Trypanosoma vivax]|nr:hypothetical protein ERJ75_000136100 [Trypanosoma vivax]KAH8619658.1 hypothetical protein ERJ75_000136600 [Trypanosoma vivax]
MLRNEWRGLAEGGPALFQQCEAARSRIHEERQNMQAQLTSASDEAGDLRQRACQLEGQNRQMLGHAKSLQGADGVLATANGHPKAGQFRKAMEIRGLGAQRTEPAAAQVGGNGFSCAHSRRTAAPKEDNAPPAQNVGFQRIRASRDELCERPSQLGEKIREHEGARGRLMATPPEHFLTACRGTFPIQPRPGFRGKARGNQWGYGQGPLARPAARKARVGRAGVFMVGGVSFKRPAKARAPRRSRALWRQKALEERRARHQARLGAQGWHGPRRVRCDASAAGERGAAAQRAMRRWPAALFGSKKRAAATETTNPGPHGIGFRRRGKQTAPQPSRSHCAARCRGKGGGRQRKKRRAVSAGEGARWETRRQRQNHRRRPQTMLSS